MLVVYTYEGFLDTTIETPCVINFLGPSGGKRGLSIRRPLNLSEENSQNGQQRTKLVFHSFHPGVFTQMTATFIFSSKEA